MGGLHAARFRGASCSPRGFAAANRSPGAGLRSRAPRPPADSSLRSSRARFARFLTPLPGAGGSDVIAL